MSEDGVVDEAERAFARAVVRGDGPALERFERELLGPLERTLAHARLDAAGLDEVRQRVRERLLVPDETGQARLVRYAGQGRLAGLVQVTAARIAVDLARARRGRAHAGGEASEHLADRAADPQLAALRAEAGERFRRAFASAVDGLDDRGRALLELHLLRGVPLERLAAMYSVHRATVVRWLADARERVLEGTRRALSSGPGGRELDEALALLESQLDASVERLFRAREGGG